MALEVKRIQLRRDTLADWTTANPILAEGEYGYETDTGYERIGDGSTAFLSLTRRGPFLEADRTKLDGIEDGADVTDTANVTAAGALMDSEVFDLAGVKSYIKPFDDYAAFAADTTLNPTNTPNGTIVEYGGFRGIAVTSGDITNSAGTPVQLDVLPMANGSYNVRAFGAVGDGVTDDTAIIQAVLNKFSQSIIYRFALSITAKTQDIFFPKGTYLVTATLQLEDAYQSKIYGEAGTIIRLDINNVASYGFELRDCNRITIENIFFDVITALDIALNLKQITALANVTPSFIKLNDVVVNGRGVVNTCISVDNRELDNNNECVYFVRNKVMGYIEQGFELYGLQIHLVHFENTNINGANSGFTASVGKYGVRALSGNASRAASFNFINGLNGWNSVADFYITGANDMGVTLDGVSSENSSAFLIVDGAGSKTNATLNHCRYSSEELAADARAISFANDGSLVMRECQFGVISANANVPQIYLNSAKSLSVDIKNSRFNASKTADTSVNSIDTKLFQAVVGANGYTIKTRVEGCDFGNAKYTTDAAYRIFTNSIGTDYTLLAHTGNDSFHFTTGAVVTSISQISALHPDQEITLFINETSFTVKHDNATGTGSKILLTAGVDFTPASAPAILKLKYNRVQNRWLQI